MVPNFLKFIQPLLINNGRIIYIDHESCVCMQGIMQILLLTTVIDRHH